MDNVIFQALAIEINRKLANSQIDKIIQVSPGSIVLRLWTGTEKANLLLQTESQGTFYITEKRVSAPDRPPRFCQLLRSRLKRLKNIYAEPCDRILHLIFCGSEDNEYDLVLEAFGNRGNLILVDSSGKIIDLIWRQQGDRKLLPGLHYRLPEQIRQRISLFSDPAEISSLLSADMVSDVSNTDIAPMSGSLAKAIDMANRSGLKVDDIIEKIQLIYESGSFRALRVEWDNQVGYLPFIFEPHEFTRVDEYPNLSALEESRAENASKESTRFLKAHFAKVIKKYRKRLNARLSQIELESEQNSDPDRYRNIGNLLLTNLNKFNRGDRTVEVLDFCQSPPLTVTIELKKEVTPQENAAHYFKRYRKAKRAVDHRIRRTKETNLEMEWLDEIEHSLNEATNSDELYQVQAELQTAGLLKQTKGKLGKRKIPRPKDQILQAKTPSGLRICWGKNSETNDYVSRYITSPEDLWFHAKGVPGAHLVLKSGGNPDKVSSEDIEFAASIAAGYSKAKTAGKAEVMIAKGKDIKRLKGARLGLVKVDSYRTVLVAPKRCDS